ncbi:hypothetical protein ACP70R_010650 [Stipagrostis hirtigluma subsp. patula]
MARSSNSTSRRLAFLLVSALAVFSPIAHSLPLPDTGAGGELSADFHANSCPQLEGIVRSAVQAALQREVALAAGLLRIFFHDCFPQGCDASVLLRDGIQRKSEQAMGPNSTLQKAALKLIDDIRAKVHAACGPTVSCADITALATRDAVVASGGPSYAVPQGQRDSFAPALESDVNALPSPFTASVRDLLDAFKLKGLGDAADLVALSGAHTVGRAHCDFFSDRAGRQDDTFSRKLAANCSRDPSRIQNLDVRTPDAFDHAYFVDLTFNQGVFTSDMALIKDRGTARIVKQFAQSKDAFFAQFAKSMIKLSMVPRKPAGNVGEIRRISCFRPNAAGSILDSEVDVDAAGAEGFAASA